MTDSLRSALERDFDTREAAEPVVPEPNPTWAHTAENDPAGLYDDNWEPLRAESVVPDGPGLRAAAQRLVDVIFAEAQAEPFILPLRGMRAAGDLRRALSQPSPEIDVERLARALFAIEVLPKYPAQERGNYGNERAAAIAAAYKESAP